MPDRPRDPPWIFRTYAGHSSARASNELYRQNLAAGQTGLSIAFDLPTQTGYDPDQVLSRGEVVADGSPQSLKACAGGDIEQAFIDLVTA